MQPSVAAQRFSLLTHWLTRFTLLIITIITLLTQTGISKAQVKISGGGTGATLDYTTTNPWTGPNSFLDNNFTILDNLDTTKKLQFQVSGVTTGATVTPSFSGAGGSGQLLVDGVNLFSTSYGLTAAGGAINFWANGGSSQPHLSIDSLDPSIKTRRNFNFCFSNNDLGANQPADTCFHRLSTGVIALNGAASATSIGTLLGGGSIVASNTALPAPTGNVFHVSGTTTITSIVATNLISGACFTMIFDGVLTVTDGSNLKLESDFVTTADDTLSVCYDGTNFYETSRKVN